MKKHTNLLGQFSPEAHFSKMIHNGKKSISLSLNELTVLPVGFNKEAMGEGEQRLHARWHVHACAHTHDHAATAADALLTVELGHAHKSPEQKHAYKHAQLRSRAQSHRGNHMCGICARKTQIRTTMLSKCHYTCTAIWIVRQQLALGSPSKYFQHSSSSVEEWGRTKGRFCISQQCPGASLLACLAQLPDTIHLFLLPTAGGQATVLQHSMAEKCKLNFHSFPQS